MTPSARSTGVQRRSTAWWRKGSRWAARGRVWIATSLLVATPAGAQSGAAAAPQRDRPRIDASVDTGRVTVGDQIAVRVRVHLSRDVRPVDTVPRAITSFPDGVRVLATEPLRRVSAGEWAGAVRIAVFRPGEIRLPPMAVAYRGAATTPVDTLIAPPPELIVAALVPGGAGTLRDIKDIERSPLSLRAASGVAAAVLVVAVFVALGATVRRRWAAPDARGQIAPPAAAPTPYAVALARLAAIADTDWTARGEVAAPFALTVDVLRQYLDDAHGIPALVRTTPELLAALPPPLLRPTLRASAAALLDRGDLIKFARLSPRPPAAAVFVAGARSLLTDWDAAVRRNGADGGADGSRNGAAGPPAAGS